MSNTDGGDTKNGNEPASGNPKVEKENGGKPEGGPANSTPKVRSETTYPYYGLDRGIEIVGAVRRAGGNEASNADVQRELNVTKVTDRLWAYGIPAATYFGLIERVGRGDEGRIKLTDLALRIVSPVSPEEERAAKVAAVKMPELYAKLIERFAGHPVPSKDGLKNLLGREFKIVESMAPIAAEAFIESVKTAGLVTADGGILTPDAAHAPGEEKPKPGAKPPGAPRPQADAPDMQTLLVPADYVIYKCKIAKGRVIDIPLPRDFTKADLGRLAAFLGTQVDDPDESA